MKPVKRVNTIFWVLLLLTISCTQTNEENLQNLSKVYVDLLVVEDYYNNTDSLAIKRSDVFKKYNLTEESYDSSFKMLKYDRELWDKFFSYSNEYLDSLKVNLKNSESLQ